MIKLFKAIVVVLSVVFMVAPYGAFAKSRAKRALVSEVLSLDKNGRLKSYSQSLTFYNKMSNAPDLYPDLLVEQIDTSNKVQKVRIFYLLRRLSRLKGFRISDKSSSTIAKLLNSADGLEEKISLLSLVRRLRPNSESIEDTIFDIIEDTDIPRLKLAAVSALSPMNLKNQKRGLLVFQNAAKSEIPRLRAYGVTGLGNSKFDSDVVVPLLVNALEDNYIRVRQSAVYALRAFGPEASAAIPQLIEMARLETGYGMKSYTIHALQSIGFKDQRVLDAFGEFLLEPSLRLTTLSHLAGLGKEATSLAPEVANCLKSNNQTERRFAVAILEEVATKSELPLIQDAVNDQDSFVRQRAKLLVKKLKKD